LRAHSGTRSWRSPRTSPAGKRVIPEALAGIDVENEARQGLAGCATTWRTAWSMLGYPPTGALHRQVRRALPHFKRLDVPARQAARASAPTTIPRQTSWPLHTITEWTNEAKLVPCTAASTANGRLGRCDGRVCELCVHRGRLRRQPLDFSFRAEPRTWSHTPGIGSRLSRPMGPQRRLGAPYILTVATLEPRKKPRPRLGPRAFRAAFR